MSKDEQVTKDILETLEDGKDGFTKGAEKLDGLDAASAGRFRELAAQRSSFADELQEMAKSYGDDPDRSGSTTATLHRRWVSAQGCPVERQRRRHRRNCAARRRPRHR